MAPVPVIPSQADTSPEAVAKALLSHIPKDSGLASPRLPPPAADAHTEPQAQPIVEPDLRQCYQIVNGCLIAVPLQLVLPKPKPKGAMKRGVAGGAAGTEDF